jgi:hypothetical protein
MLRLWYITAQQMNRTRKGTNATKCGIGNVENVVDRVQNGRDKKQRPRPLIEKMKHEAEMLLFWI